MLEQNPQIQLQLMCEREADLARKLRHAHLPEESAAVTKKDRRRTPLELLRIRLRLTGDAS